MTNRNAETLTHLYAARTALTAYRQSLDQANAATQPSAKLTALYTARDRHTDYLAALKRGDYVYRDGKGSINTKLGFDFEKTVADSGADKWDVWQKIEPLAAGDVTAIGNTLQTVFPDFIEGWRLQLVSAINTILQARFPELPTAVLPTWVGRDFVYAVIARAELETYVQNQTTAFPTLLETAITPEFQTAVRDWYLLKIRGLVGSTFLVPNVVNVVDLGAGYRYLVDGQVTAANLDGLTQRLVQPAASALKLELRQAMNMALKNTIIARVNEMVGFEYTGAFGEEALPTLVNGVLTPWTDQSVSARALYENVPFRYRRFQAALKAIQLANQGSRGDTSDGNVDGIQFPNVGTDSARFISFCLRAGGIPMMTTGIINTCDPDVSVGWCVAPPLTDLGAFRDNLIWRNHNETNTVEDTDTPVDLPNDARLAGFLLGNPNVLGGGITLFYNINNQFVSNTASGVEKYKTISIDQVIGLNSNSDTYFPSGYPLSEILEDRKYAEIATNLGAVAGQIAFMNVGDYVVTRGTQSAHGFIITGRQAAVKCVGSPASGTPLSQLDVLYVADLPGTQDGDPRPFYCTRIPEDFGDEFSFFDFYWWYFIKVPDLWLISFDRLYPDPLPRNNI